jgi:hypothetical protein
MSTKKESTSVPPALPPEDASPDEMIVYAHAQIAAARTALNQFYITHKLSQEQVWELTYLLNQISFYQDSIATWELVSLIGKPSPEAQILQAITKAKAGV